MEALDKDIQEERPESQRRRPLPILEKKLDELESQLEDFFLQNPTKESFSVALPDLNHLRRAKIEAKIEFIKNLLTREMEPHAPTTPEQLNYADRLAVLEDSYRRHHHHISDSAPSDDEHSTCSCTQSCFAEGEECDIQGLEAAASVPESMIVTAPAPAPAPASQEDGKVVKQQEKTKVWSNSCIVGTVVGIIAVVGAVAMNFCIVDDDRLVPTSIYNAGLRRKHG